MTEEEIRQKALWVIEELSCSDEFNMTVAAIYRIAHSANSPSCRKNHPEWMEPILNAANREDGANE